MEGLVLESDAALGEKNNDNGAQCAPYTAVYRAQEMMTPPPGRLTMRSLVLVFGAGAMVSQVLILRELLVLAQGQELKLALGLWGWLLWVGLGSLAGGRLHAPGGPGVGPGRLGGLLALLGLLLPATILASRSLPSLAHLPLGQSLPLSTTFLLFVLLLAPFGLVSGYFFPGAVQALAARGSPKGRGPGLLSGDPGRGPGGRCCCSFSWWAALPT